MKGYLKKGDNVFVTSGNSKGKTGEIMAFTKEKVLLKGINVRKKTIKNQKDKKSSKVIQVEMPIHISNVALCDKDGKKIKKLKVKKTDKGKQLVYASGGKDVVYRTLKKS